MPVTASDIILYNLTCGEATSLGFTLGVCTNDGLIHLSQTHPAYVKGNTLARFETVAECRAYLAGWGDSRQCLKNERIV